MELAIGRNPVTSLLRQNQELTKMYCIYRCFFDDMKSLTNLNFISYINELNQHVNEIKYAVYPDFVRAILRNIPTTITYVYPVHELYKDLEFMDELKSAGFTVIAGYPSGDKNRRIGKFINRDYEIDEFVSNTRSYEKWYLGVSSWKRLDEAINHRFDYADVTTMLLGRFKDIKNLSYVTRRLIEVYNYVNKQIRFF